MVQFNEKDYTVTIYTGMNPIEDWKELQDEILSVLAALDTQTNCMPMPYRLLNFLREMQPDLEIARKMTN